MTEDAIYHGEDRLEIGQAQFGDHLVYVVCPPDSAFTDNAPVEVIYAEDAVFVLLSRRVLETYLAAYGDALTANYQAVRDVGLHLAERLGW